MAATSTTPPAPVGSSSSISQITHRPASAIGIAVGAAILGISLLASLGWCYYRYKRGRRKTERGAASDRDKLDDALGIASRLSTTQHVVPSPIHDPRSHPPLLGYVGSEVSTTPATVAPSVYSAHPVLASLDIPKQTASQPRDLREELARRMRGIEEHVAELRRQESSGTVSRTSASTSHTEEAPAYGLYGDDNAALRRHIEYLEMEVERLRAAQGELDELPPAYNDD